MYNPVPTDVRELDECFGDFLLLRNDAAVVDCHPTAAEMVRWETSLEDIVRRVARLGYGDRIQSRHLTASDFGSSLSVAMARVVGVDYTAAADEVSAVVKNVTAHGVRPVETPTLMLGDIVQADFARLLPLATVATGDSVDVSLYAARFLIGRALILNDEAGAVATAASQLGGMAARLEAKAVAAVLNSPTTAMADGTARFVSGTNETVATGLDVSSANEALGLLRQQTFTGPNGFESGYVNAIAKTLLVPPSSLATAWTLNVAFGQPLRIVSNAWLDGSAAFLFADPQVAPALIRARPRAYQTPGIVQTAAVDNLPDGTEQQFDGLAMRFEHAFGIGMASRLGVVRIPLS
jgi:hypothetical protein